MTTVTIKKSGVADLTDVLDTILDDLEEEEENEYSTFVTQQHVAMKEAHESIFKEKPSNNSRSLLDSDTEEESEHNEEHEEKAVVDNPILKHKIEQSVVIDKEPVLETEHAEPVEIKEPTKEELELQRKKAIEESKKVAQTLEESNTFISNKSICSDLQHIKFYLFAPLYAPRNADIPLVSFVNGIITHNEYSPWRRPINNPYNIPEKMVIINKLETIFNTTFVKSVENSLDFPAIITEVVMFMGKSELPSVNLESLLINPFLNKLIIALNSKIELAFKAQCPTVNSQLKVVLSRARVLLELISSQSAKSLKASINEVVTNVFNESDNKFVYNHKSFAILNKMIKSSWDNKNNGPLFENMVGSMLKCYFHSFIIDYFNVIVSMYIITRLLSIYLQTETIDKSNTEEDIKVIAMFGVVCYENTDYLYKGVARVFPKFKNQMSSEAETYYLKHLFTGPQYAILKEFEYVLPKMMSIV
jgi:hypothetical protein